MDVFGETVERGSPSETDILTVSQLTSRIRDIMQDRFSRVSVTGEVTNASQPQSGHIYLTLADASAQLRAVIWRGTAAGIRFALEEGLEVVCHGDVDVYPPRGTYQLIIRRIEPVGQGALQLALKQLQKRLGAEGLFDAQHKKALPTFPRRIAVVTSPSGAAIRDFLKVAARRWQGADILIIPTRVQGEGAAPEIARAIDTAHRLRPAPDVLVVTRGGGSAEDLWCFNEEVVVRAIFACEIPVVSAVGHEIDVTLSDLVADRRALTPSEAAELVVPSSEELAARLGQLLRRGMALVGARLQHSKLRLERLARRRSLLRPAEAIHDRMRGLDELRTRLDRAAHRRLTATRETLGRLTSQLHSLSPQAVLARGYSVTTSATTGRIVRSLADVPADGRIMTQVMDGRIVSHIESRHSEPPRRN
jgi:exodeoxyribonuclease VII large subunit